jgi:hypothetical protein
MVCAQKLASIHIAAQHAGLSFPDIERPQLYAMRPERAAMDVLLWTRDMQEAQRIARDVAAEYAQCFHALETPQDGVLDWLQSLQAARVPMALVANLDRCAASIVVVQIKTNSIEFA